MKKETFFIFQFSIQNFIEKPNPDVGMHGNVFWGDYGPFLKIVPGEMPYFRPFVNLPTFELE